MCNSIIPKKFTIFNIKTSFIYVIFIATNPETRGIKALIKFKSKLIINRGLKPINPIQCGQCQCPPGYGYGPSVRKFWLLHFVISGKGRLINERGSYDLSENQIFVIRPYETATYVADETEPWDYIWIGFSAENDAPPILNSNDVIFAPYLRELFISAFYDDFFSDENTGGAYESFLCGIIWQMFGKLMYGSIGNLSVYESYIRPAISIMRSDYPNSITVSDIASRLHISRGHFSKIFKEETGVSPKKYLNDIRMKKAAELIVRNGMSLTVTASTVGYPDVFTLSRAFKAHYGCNPTEYKLKNKLSKN